MKVIVHDLQAEQFQLLFPLVGESVEIVSDSGGIRPCVGCFGCWVKNPGRCILRDGYDTMGATLSNAEEVVIISRCCYGGFSPFVKNVWDRSISYLLPFFKTKRNETHHPLRYRHTFGLCVYFYGEAIPEPEKETARKLVAANCINFSVPQHAVSFYCTPDQLCKEVKLQ